ncbi:MAG TPA: DUF3276 family protein [Saprospiraceae bacterium]|nr:DUF3276 family protein [Saprospiraceae bacterium]
MENNNNELYSDKFTKGFRTYFFNIKVSEKDDLYLKITESRMKDLGFERQSLIIFDENLDDFVNAFKNSITKFREFRSLRNPDGKSYSVQKIRQKYPKAYLPWTTEDDIKLETLFCEGKKSSELVQLFGRNIGAINSRIETRA